MLRDARVPMGLPNTVMLSMCAASTWLPVRARKPDAHRQEPKLRFLSKLHGLQSTEDSGSKSPAWTTVADQQAAPSGFSGEGDVLDRFKVCEHGVRAYPATGLVARPV